MTRGYYSRQAYHDWGSPLCVCGDVIVARLLGAVEVHHGGDVHGVKHDHDNGRIALTTPLVVVNDNEGHMTRDVSGTSGIRTVVEICHDRVTISTHLT